MTKSKSTVPETDILCGLEHEVMTKCVGGRSVEEDVHAAKRLLQILADSNQSLPGPNGRSSDIFLTCGRFMIDHGAHLEYATRECGSPFELVRVIREQEQLLAAAQHQLKEEGCELFLSNCNHSGTLQPAAPTWGCHENILVRDPPEDYAGQLLPFLATAGAFRGAGGLLKGKGFVACSRSIFMEHDRGGATTSERAVFSTARREHLTSDPSRYGYRLHLIDSDGQRADYSRLLKSGTMTLVCKAIESGRRVQELVPLESPEIYVDFWLKALHDFNVLSRDGLDAPLRLASEAIDVQQIYFQLVDDWFGRTSGLAGWIGPFMAIWETMIDKIRSQDTEFLSCRLDPWIKHKQMTNTLSELGLDWSDAAADGKVQSVLSTWNQDYHSISSDSAYAVSVEHGAIDELRSCFASYMKEGPRAAARARAIEEFYSRSSGITATWDSVTDENGSVLRVFDEPSHDGEGYE
jgi:hypothetical protein